MMQYLHPYKMVHSAVFGHMSYVILLVSIRDRPTGQENTTKINSKL